MSDFVVVNAHPQMLRYVDDLQRKNAAALSFYPTAVLERECEAGRIFLGILNGEPCGYIWIGAANTDIKCHQVCIQYDARNRMYGMALVTVLEDYSLKSHAYTVTLRCGFDLDANEFWRSLGYGVVAIRQGGVRRMRQINVWQKQISPGLFLPVHLEPAKGVASAAMWSRHKRTGITSQFIRGRALKQYRDFVLAGAGASE